ncbi:hypothetical protein B0H14DRAFT_3130587 [Mycena olivaceomarginata]|nr:hypothetical protein B0H14DRAFT_3130587 [Mycena olivaceomarginata]
MQRQLLRTFKNGNNIRNPTWLACLACEAIGSTRSEASAWIAHQIGGRGCLGWSRLQDYTSPHYTPCKQDLNVLEAGMTEGVTFGMLLRPVPAAKQQIINTALQVFETTGAEQEYLAAVGCGAGWNKHIAITKAVFVLMILAFFGPHKGGDLLGLKKIFRDMSQRRASQHINLKSKMWDDRLVKFLDKAVLAHSPNIISKIYRDGQSFLSFDPKGLPKQLGKSSARSWQYQCGE